MAIIYLHTPKEIDFAGNPVSLKIHGTRFVKSAGSKALLSLQVTGVGPVEFNSISFTVLNTDISLMFSGVPDDSGHQILANVEMTLPHYISELAKSLKSIPLLGSNFKITYSAAACIIFLEALEPGEEYSFLNTQIVSDNLIVHQSIPGTDYETETNYQFSTTIHEIINNLPSKLTTLIHDPDIDGNSVINIGEKVKHLNWAAPIPDLSWTTSQLSDLSKRFICKCAEKIDGSLLRIYDSPEIRMLPGTITFHLWPDFSIENEVISKKLFYTVKAPIQRTWIEAKEFLNFLIPVDEHDISIAISVTYTDGSVENKLLEVKHNVSKFDLLTIPVGVDQIGMQQWNPEKEIYCYEVRIYSQGGDQNLLLAKPFTYQVEKIKPWFRQLLFTNQFGVWENINITGKAKRVVAPSREETQKIHQYNYNPLHPEKRSVVTDTDDYIEVITGVALNITAEILNHLIRTTELFLIADNGLIPVTLRDGSFEIQDETKDLISIKLQLKGIDGSDGLISHFAPGSYSEDYSNSYD